MKYSFTCSCGDVIPVDAATRQEAIEKAKGMMNEKAVSKHMAEKHKGEPVPSMEQVEMMISQSIQPMQV